VVLASLICILLLPNYLHKKQEVDVRFKAPDSIARRLILNTLVDTTEKISNDRQNDDPIEPNDKICSEYLQKFLAGSTDGNDECQGLANAYNASECVDENEGDLMTQLHLSYNDPPPSYLANTNSTDDDEVPTIDDIFEDYECCKIIQKYYVGRCHSTEKFASLTLLGVVSVLILCGFFKTLIQGFQLHWLPEAGGCILVGAFVGAIMRLILPTHHIYIGTFNDDLFLFILLPPIIFNAALSIDKSRFKSLLFPIIMFAVFGTIISAVITGFIVYGITSLGWITTPIPLLDSMIFGALISSVDPVATLSVLGSMGVPNTDLLYVVVFGESILNDGVSIALFESLVLHLDGTTELNRAIVWDSTLYFCKATSTSIAIGLACGVLCTIYFWCLRGRQSPVSEVAAFFCFALMAYYISEGLRCSGIVSIMIAGFFMDVYVRGHVLSEADLHRQILQSEESGNAIDGGAVLPPRCSVPSWSDWKVMFCGIGHISQRAKVHVGFVSDVIANLLETSIFAYLGLFLFTNIKWNDVPFIFTGILSSVASRFFMIIIISIIVNSCLMIRRYLSNCNAENRDHRTPENSTGHIDRNMQVILLFSGVRGAVSLALVENIPLYNVFTKHGSNFKLALKTMTCSSIIFTVFFFGACTYRTLKRQREAINQPDALQRETEIPLAEASLTDLLLEDVSQEVRQ